MAWKQFSHSPVCDSQSNERADGSIRRAVGFVRTVKSGLESELVQNILRGDYVLGYSNAAAYVLTYTLVTLMDLHHTCGYVARMQTIQCASWWEHSFYQPLATRKSGKDKDAEKYLGESCFGIIQRTSETIVGTARCAVRARSLRRPKADQKWDAKFVNAVKGAPTTPRSGMQPRPNPS